MKRSRGKRFNHGKIYRAIDRIYHQEIATRKLGMPLNVVARHEWHAKPPLKRKPMNHPVKYIVIWYNTYIDACEDDETCIYHVKELQERDLRMGMSDIKYNFIIGGNGKTYEGRGWFTQPSERLPFSRYHGCRLDIAHIGTYVGGENVLPWPMMDQELNIISYGKEKEYITKYYTMIEEERKFL